MKLDQVNKFNMHLVTTAQAFEWVKTGAWNKQQFEQWVNVVKYYAYCDGVARVIPTIEQPNRNTTSCIISNNV